MSEFWKKINKSDIRNILAVMIVLGVFILLYLMMVKEIPVNNQALVNTAVGLVFGGALAGVVGFYFGASKTENNNTTTNKDNE